MTKIKRSILSLKKYITGYDQKYFYKCTTGTFIDDILYGLGISLDKKYEYRDGFQKFKSYLIKHIEKSLEIKK